jgi:enamine deaminase RidA (YjgF/YER057c/UK114 family)
MQKAFAEPLQPEKVHKPPSRYSHALLHPLGGGARRLVLSGQVGMAPDGTVAKGMAAQIEQAWDNLLAILAAAGMRAHHVVKVTVFVTDRSAETLRLVRETRDRRLEGHAPAMTYLVVAGLASPEFMVEIEAEAVAAE